VYCIVLQSDCYFRQNIESSAVRFIKCEAVPPQVNETQIDMQPIVVKKPRHSAR